MGQSTSIHYYAETKPADPKRALAEVLNWLSPEHIMLTRNPNLDTSWADYRSEGGEEVVSYEILMQRVSIAEALELYVSGSVIT